MLLRFAMFPVGVVFASAALHCVGLPACSVMDRGVVCSEPPTDGHHGRYLVCVRSVLRVCDACR